MTKIGYLLHIIIKHSVIIYKYILHYTLQKLHKSICIQHN